MPYPVCPEIAVPAQQQPYYGSFESPGARTARCDAAGSSRKMDTEAARRKARERKAEALGMQGL